MEQFKAWMQPIGFLIALAVMLLAIILVILGRLPVLEGSLIAATAASRLC